MRRLRLGLSAALMIVLAAAGIWFLSGHRGQEAEVTYTEMAEGSLPVLYMDFDGGRINTLHGYAGEMELSLVRDTITELSADRQLTVEIATADATESTSADSLTYWVRSLDGETLIDQETLTDFSVKGEIQTANLELTALLEQDREYQLIFCVTTGEQDVYYYTRIIYGDDMHTAELCEFAQEFSEATFDRETARSLIRPFVQNDNSDYDGTFAYTDLHSSLTKITWGDLNPERTGSTEMRITEISSTQVTLELSYQMRADDSLGICRDYDVTEEFCLRDRGGKIYVLDYARTVEQVFTGDKTAVSSGAIRIGIADGDQIDVMSDEKGNYTVFTYGKELWCYDAGSNEMVRVYTFHGNSENAVRDDYEEHDISPIKVDSDGNIYFMVYGYMNRGIHEGESGISFCRYNSEDNAITELHFIPAEESYQVLKQDLSRLAYVTEEHQCYFLYGSNLYRIDLIGSDYEVISEAVDADTYVRSTDGTCIAWQNIGSEHGKISVMDMDAGTLEELTPGDGQYLRTFGYIQDNLIYGVGRDSDIQTEAGRDILYPCYNLKILDRELNVVEDYLPDGMYVTEAEIETGRVILTRVQKSSDGMVEAPQDILLMNSAAIDQTSSTVKTITSDAQRTEYLINLGLRDSQSNSLVFNLSAPKFVVGSGDETDLTPSETRKEMFFVYARGELAGLCRDMAAAIDIAYDQMGVITNASGETLWDRNTRELSVALDLPETSGSGTSLEKGLQLMLSCAGESGAELDMTLSPYENLEQVLGDRAVEMYGCRVSQVLFYLNLGAPVLAVTGDDTCLLITGYETSTITVYDPADGSETVMSSEDADAWFSAEGNRFVSFLPEED